VTSLLRFESVTCSRGGRLLFETLDLALGPGEALQLKGPNGSGKSSLIRVAAALLRPDAGKVEAAPLALADDNLALDRELPLEGALRLWGGAAAEAIAALGLAKLAGVPVRLLSAGQGKRAALARVAASDAKLWLLDEPANALDSRSIELLAKLLERHRETGGAVVAASHVELPGEWRTLELGG
jgi:heme exporter protein A